MSLFKTHTLTVNRYSNGTYVKGKWVPGGLSSSFPIQTSVQPLTGYDLQTLPEGLDVSTSFMIFPVEELRAADPKNSVPGDIVVMGGVNYMVQLVNPEQNGVIPHYETVISRVRP